MSGNNGKPLTTHHEPLTKKGTDPMKILHLIDSLDYSGSARQLQLLGPAQANDGMSVEVCCLGRASTHAEPPAGMSFRRPPGSRRPH